MKNRLRYRLLSAACAVTMLFSSAGKAIFSLADAASQEISAVYTEDTDYCQQNFELHPNGDDAGQIITLEGLMPEGAEAEAVDVSDEFGSIAAYDITITDGMNEYQPDEEHPVYVEITDPAIPESDNLELWHIKDNGEREQVPYFSIGKGRISFSAAGFSVYEIIEGKSGFVPDKEAVTSVDELTGDRADSGFYLLYSNNKNEYFFTSELNDNDCLTETSEIQSAATWYFEQNGSNYNIYTYVNGVKKYIHNKSGNLIELSESAADAFEISPTASRNSFNLKKKDEKRWIQHSGSGDGIRYYTDIKNIANSSIIMYYADKVSIPEDFYELDGKSYGLMNYTSGTHGYALMADSEVHTLIQLVTHQKSENDDGVTLYVDESNEVTRWTFDSLGEDRYTLSAETGSGTKYLAVSGDSLVLADTEESAAVFKAVTDSSGKIRLSCDEKYIAFSRTETDDGTVESFYLSADSSANTWLYLIGFANLTDEDLITYSADRISVSEAENGQRVIVYTRIWNEENKRYDMYAVDYNGTLYPCYASGGKILWLGDGTCSLEWIFTEYRDAVTKLPNYYYELYNPYSEKYIAPQIEGQQTLSEDTIGINIPGRRNGEFYSELIAWDNSHYAYIGMKPDENNTRLVPCSQSTSVPFYFAVLEELNLSDKLHPVDTVDNKEHGITMKMINFQGDSSKGSDGAFQQNEYLVNKKFVSDKPTKDLLSNSLDNNGYPVAVQSGKYLGDLYSGAQTVNHLFLDSVYNSSGYFEFDSTQNFATLNATNDNNFKVYRELGTSDGETKPTLKHGQFFPYNTITPQNYSASNPTNLYNTDARTNDQNKGVLADDDPRKYEPLYSAGNKNPNSDNPINYYFGMEMSAQFVQTVSGLDAWGHDIIFEFKGDDDFWFYVDDELVIDLGGIHSALSGTVNFRTGEVSVCGEKTTLRDIFRKNYIARGEENVDSKLDELFEDNGKGQYVFKDYTTHKMRVFYMERGAGASNLRMRFNIASVTPGHVVVSKTVSGEGADVLDTDFIEYPFQIYYTVNDGDGGSEGEEKLLENSDSHISVTYQNSNKPVTFVKKYRPPGFSEENAYKNIYFLNPKKNAEISFPDNTIRYRIVECAVDSTVYENVMINGKPVPPGRVEIKGELRSYSSDSITAEERPTIAFDNVVKEDVIKDLFITKKLLDENEQEITDDPATFNFRLYLSSFDVSADEMPLANMYKYYVISPDKRMCRFDSGTHGFVDTGIYYSHDIIKELSEGSVDGITADDITFYTSGFGAISGIPAGYTICVPGLPVGSLFKVTEDVRAGYGLKGYKCILGEKVREDNTSEDIPSYYPYGNNPDNVGRVRAEENPQMEVQNRKGYGLTVNKKWSDLSITTYHAPVYVAVYVDGELLEDSVKQIASPSTSAYYFWDSLEPYSDDSPRTNFNGYEVKEVVIGGTPIVSDDGSVTGYSSVTPLNSSDKLNLTATRTMDSTPAGELQDKDYNYVVSYETGEDEGSSRTDTIINNREGGIAVRLFKWDSTVPLSGGKFTLADSSGKTVGIYKSDSGGIITMLYSFEPDKLYTLTQTSAPKGYVGLQKKLRFRVRTDETVELYYENGTDKWGGDDNKWADRKTGENGIIAFVDIYNKPFNFKIIKTDNDDSGIKLDSAHFALYKQANTTISGYVKNKEPMTGFGDMITVNGEVDVCGGNSGRAINLGENGSVFFLTETEAPQNYSRLREDIIFRISAIGVPELVSDSYNGQLIETEDSYIYTLSVPNEKNKNVPTGISNTLAVSLLLVAVPVLPISGMLYFKKRKRD